MQKSVESVVEEYLTDISKCWQLARESAAAYARDPYDRRAYEKYRYYLRQVEAGCLQLTSLFVMLQALEIMFSPLLLKERFKEDDKDLREDSKVNLDVDDHAKFEFREWLSSLGDTVLGDVAIAHDSPLFWWLWEGRKWKRYLSYLKVRLSHIEYGLNDLQKVVTKPLPTWARYFQEEGVNIEKELTAREALAILDRATKGG
jgi:hypothetical protein